MDTSELEPSGSGSAGKRHSKNISIAHTANNKSPFVLSSANQAPTLVEEAASISVPQTPSTAATSNPLWPPKPLAVRSPTPPAAKDLSFLLRPSNFRKVSQTEISPPFRSAPVSPGTTLPSLLRQGHYYRAALLAASSLVTEAELSQEEIFELLYVRLACLTLIKQTPLAGKERLALGDIHSPFYLDEHGECILPWELRVLTVRLQAQGAGDPRRGVQGYYDLAAYARMRIRWTYDVVVKGVWEERLQDLGVRVGNALVEMGDLEAGRRHFESLIKATTDQDKETVLGGWVAMLCLRMGDLESARTWLSTRDDDLVADEASGNDPLRLTKGPKNDMLEALLSVAEGDYEAAVAGWRSLADGPYSVLAKQNLAVCLLYTGRISEASQLLEELVDEKHAFYALTFNLATIYELSTDKSRDRKMQLAERVAKGLRSPMNEAAADRRRMERSNMDFKL
ncbi:MAG: hypothetical protein Q9209_006022 [Squamulea sp. 1 TL-2023]